MVRRFWKHQFDGFVYARHEQDPALFMDMRLGKTTTFIRRANLYEPRNKRHGLKILVVATNSSFDGWEEEWELEGEDSVLFLNSGTREERVDLLYHAGAKWTFINHEGYRALPELKDIDWDVVCLDESSVYLRNPKAKITKFYLKYFRDVPHKWLMTGTPNPESDLDYVTQLLFLDGHFCGCKNYWDFRNKYYTINPDGFGWTPKAGTLNMIRDYVGERCFILRRKDAGMPDKKIYQTRYVELPPDIREIYNNMESDFMLEVNGEIRKSTVWATGKYIMLRRLCGGWLGDQGEVWDGMIKELVTLLTTELKNEQVVVWFVFNDEIKRALKALNAKYISAATITGETDLDMRRTYRRGFQEGKIRILLIQAKVAETGMNLSAADTAIYFSEPVSLLTNKQTEDRILSLNKSGPLLYIHLVARNTINNDVRNVMKTKKFKNDVSIRRALETSLRERLS